MNAPVDTIAVIVPTVGKLDLTELKEAIRRQTRPADEIIVIEDRCMRGSA